MEINKKLTFQFLSQYPDDLQRLLLEYGKYISNLDVDYLIFMARKSIRIYDALLKIGIIDPKSAVLSDRVLDQNLEIFKNKKIALIDDTLIVGTTLSKIKRKLKKVTSNVTTHVFATDNEWWCKELIIPDKIFKEMNSDELLSFCASEVKSLLVTSTPYLVDFPSIKKIRIKTNQINNLLSIPYWSMYKISNQHLDKNNTLVYTVLPNGDCVSLMEHRLGKNLFKLLDIIKIRLFGRIHDNAIWFEAIPITTLNPLENENLEKLFRYLLDIIFEKDEEIIGKISDYLITPQAKLRLIQFIISNAVGVLFINNINEYLSLDIKSSIDINEARRHFGYWLDDEIKTISINSYVSLLSKESKKPSLKKVTSSFLPQYIDEKTNEDYHSYIKLKKQKTKIKTGDFNNNIFTDIIQLFTGLHLNYELPAREEARKYGEDIFEISSELVPHRDRLDYGLAWSKIFSNLCKDYKLKYNRKTSSLLSLLLDYLIDLGIAVPIICFRNNIVFRAYRHGEDVLITDQEIVLAYSAFEGYLKGANSKQIPDLRLQKLLTSLIKVGVQDRFLEPINGITGIDGIARIGYHLHGAIPILPNEDDSFLAEKGNTWLSSYLVDREVIRKETKSHKKAEFYSLGEQPQGSVLNSNAISKAKNLGYLLGKLSIKDKYSKTNPPLHDDNNLILLTTCTTIFDTIKSLVAELNVILNWYARKGRYKISRFNLQSVKENKNNLKFLLSNNDAYTAINSAKFKFIGYKDNLPSKINDDCVNYLQSQFEGDFLASTWEGWWKGILNSSSAHENEKFHAWIKKIVNAIIDIAVSLFDIELSLQSQRIKLEKKDIDKIYIDSCKKVEKYLKEIKSKVDTSAVFSIRFLELQKAAQNLLLIDDPVVSIKKSINDLNMNLANNKSLLSDVKNVIDEVTTNSRQHKFKYLVWYDIIDSTGDKSNLKGNRLSLYREKVKLFRESINKNLLPLTFEAKNNKSLIYITDGPVNSKNDEKHIFISGEYAFNWAKKTISLIINKTIAFNPVRVRLLLIPCEFAGTSVYKFHSDPNVISLSFWEHLSRIKQQLKKLENNLNCSRTILFLAGDDVLNNYNFEEQYHWDGSINEIIETSPDGFVVKTKIKGGELIYN